MNIKKILYTLLFIVTFFPTAKSVAQSYNVTLVKINRSVHPSGGDHLFSANPQEGPAAHYIPENNGHFLVLGNMDLGFSIPLMRCTTPGLIPQIPTRHFLSRDPYCEGQGIEGLLGYMSMGPQTMINSTPLFRFFNPQTGDHFVTIYNRPYPGYINEGVLGYVIPIAYQ